MCQRRCRISCTTRGKPVRLSMCSSTFVVICCLEARCLQCWKHGYDETNKLVCLAHRYQTDGMMGVSKSARRWSLHVRLWKLLS